MRYIAILKSKEYWEEEYKRAIVENVTEFTEVDDTAYAELKMAVAHLNSTYGNGDGIHTIVEQVTNAEDFIFRTIENYKKYAHQLAEKRKKEKLERENKKQEKELKRLAKNKEQEKKLFKQLKQKYEKGA